MCAYESSEILCDYICRCVASETHERAQMHDNLRVQIHAEIEFFQIREHRQVPWQRSQPAYQIWQHESKASEEKLDKKTTEM